MTHHLQDTSEENSTISIEELPVSSLFTSRWSWKKSTVIIIMLIFGFFKNMKEKKIKQSKKQQERNKTKKQINNQKSCMFVLFLCVYMLKK